MAREGRPFLAIFLLLSFALWQGGKQYHTAMLYPAGLCGLLSAFMVFFFRDPVRTPPAGDGLVLSAADGTIVDIEQIENDEYSEFLGGKVIRISTFLSIFNVHVNRAPVAGAVDFVRWRPGRFRAAFIAAASQENEHNIIGIRTKESAIIVKQIAGVLARRIVCRLKPHDDVQLGDRFGMIRFGSRVDLILPATADLHVEIGDRVRAGETIIGEIRNG